MSTDATTDSAISGTASTTADIVSTALAAVATATSTGGSDSKGSSVSIGAIVGLVCGALCLFGLGSFFVILRRRRLKEMGIHDTEAHLHETTQRTPERPTTVIEIRTGRRRRHHWPHRHEEWVEPPPTYQEAHADGVVPSYDEHHHHNPLNILAAMNQIHLRSPLSLRSFRIARTPRSPNSRTPASMRSPLHSPLHSPVVLSREPSPSRQPANLGTQADEIAREEHARTEAFR